MAAEADTHAHRLPRVILFLHDYGEAKFTGQRTPAPLLTFALDGCADYIAATLMLFLLYRRLSTLIKVFPGPSRSEIQNSVSVVSKCAASPIEKAEISVRTRPRRALRSDCRPPAPAAAPAAPSDCMTPLNACARVRTLQRKRARMQEIRNDNWNDPMVEIKHSHKAYWGLAKALKTERAIPTPALKELDNSIAFNDREKAECLTDSIKQQCSENPPFDVEHVRREEEEVRPRVPPKGDLDPITQDEVSKYIKALKIRKAPGVDSITNKALKCFPAPLVALLVAIFNACNKNCYFPTAWKEGVVIEIPKPGKPRDLLASYRPISLLSILVKLFEKKNVQNSRKRTSDRPVMTYASLIFAHAQPDALYDLQIVKNKFCRRIADAPWLVKNSALHPDLEL
ncbi:Probable RNA-directed DNA polymerase from transposon BS [Eumeta japonica]|uniref:Probable RNA-directed DNA polymerase from transposon BS n=1 Tax=Eumeta variegata TaxID=151549 RepID=A0A4C1XAG0_EUMVA|nr:Probable RNA-directed DNA polymerase from transposon BS [Eumeta japonica]